MNAMTPHDRDGIFVEIVAILTEMTVDWDMAIDSIELDTDIIADLGFVSVDVIQLIVAIESRFKRRDLAFDKLLMRDGAYVEALYVRNVIDHLHERLNAAAA
jgi:acyl carrier protein